MLQQMTDEEYQEKYGQAWEYQKEQDARDSQRQLMSPAQIKEQQEKAVLQQEMEKHEKNTAIAKLKLYASMEEVQKHFITLLGDRQGKKYAESVVIAVMNKPELQTCSPKSIMIAAMRSASLGLSVDPALKQAHLVPFGNEVTLIVDYHGLVQMTTATRYYEIPPNVFEVYEGEEVVKDRFSGRIEIKGKATSDVVIGHCGYFKAKDGTERFLYMTNEECYKHAETYNPGGYRSKKSPWNKNPTDRQKMCRKTVLRQLVSRWGNFSPVQQQYFYADEPVIDAPLFDLPSDENLEVPDEPELTSEERQARIQKNVKELGYKNVQ